jgi:hypothetical protein
MEEWGNNSMANSHKSSDIETSQSKSSAISNASSKGKSATRSSTALQTISEHKSDKSNTFVSPPRIEITSPSSSLHQSQLAGSFLRMTSEGRFLFNNAFDIDDESLPAPALNMATFDMNGADVFSPTESSLRRRAFTGQSSKTNKSEAEQTTSSNQWEQVKNILRKDDVNVEGSNKKTHEIETGVWTVPSFRETASSMKKSFIEHLKAIGRWTRLYTRNNPLSQKIAKDSTYAVVTFSSRQAAVAARHCIADGRGVERWLSLETVPVVSIMPNLLVTIKSLAHALIILCSPFSPLWQMQLPAI